MEKQEEKQERQKYRTYSLVICPICQKEFVAYPDHIYYIYKHGGRKIRFCSWKCTREYEKQREEKKKNRKMEQGEENGK